MNCADGLKTRGKVELFITKGAPAIVHGPLLRVDQFGRKVFTSAEIDFSKVEMIEKRSAIMNIILDQGKDRVIESLTTGFIRVIARMAVGDQGTIPSDSTVPKVPDGTETGLYREVYRADLDTLVLDIGTPGVHRVQFVRTFVAADVPITAFSNQANPVINEVGLVVADLLSGNPLPRPPVNPPASPDADEEVFALRTFKSVPFEAANDISVTCRYTIFIE